MEPMFLLRGVFIWTFFYYKMQKRAHDQVVCYYLTLVTSVVQKKVVDVPTAAGMSVVPFESAGDGGLKDAGRVCSVHVAQSSCWHRSDVGIHELPCLDY